MSGILMRKGPEEVSSTWERFFLLLFFKDGVMKVKGSKEGTCCLSPREEEPCE